MLPHKTPEIGLITTTFTANFNDNINTLTAPVVTLHHFAQILDKCRINMLNCSISLLILDM